MTLQEIYEDTRDRVARDASGMDPARLAACDQLVAWLRDQAPIVDMVDRMFRDLP